MTDKPIPFTGPMVRAILEGRKAQTRRVLRALPQREGDSYVRWPVYGVPRDKFVRCGESLTPERAAPYYPGQRLWVRETWGNRYAGEIAYRADGELAAPIKWRSPRFMPRALSRLTLLVTEVRVQRLQEISEADAQAEGAGLYVPGHGFITDADLRCDPGYSNFLAPRMGFEAIWAEIYGPDAWVANPWVAAISFEVEK
jgi:hypothetical protein